MSIVHKEVSIHLHSIGVRLAGGSNSNRHFSLDAIYQKLYSLCCMLFQSILTSGANN